jgi:hypothetical protein
MRYTVADQFAEILAAARVKRIYGVVDKRSRPSRPGHPSTRIPDAASSCVE